jgi:hypothetical protein
MELLNNLQREYDDLAIQLAHPIDLADFQHLKERRDLILHEARSLAKELQISGSQWFAIGV